MISIYTAGSAGAMEGRDGGGWRDDLPDIEGVRWIRPTLPPGATSSNFFRPPMFLTADLVGLRNADLMLVVFESGGRIAQHGTSTEVGIAYARGIPMIAVVPDDGAAFAFRFPIGLIPVRVKTIGEALEIIRFTVGQEEA
jgi:hypothetical protein